jgi:hypothetical protein
MAFSPEDGARTPLIRAHDVHLLARCERSTAWSVSILGPSGNNKAEVRFGDGSPVPTYTHLSW